MEGEEGRPRASDLGPLSLYPQPLLPLTAPHPRQAGQGPQCPDLRKALRPSTQELRAVHIRLDQGLLTTAHPYHKLHTSHSLQGHTPSTPPSSHTTGLTPPHTQPSVPTLTTNSLTVDSCPEPPTAHAPRPQPKHQVIPEGRVTLSCSPPGCSQGSVDIDKRTWRHFPQI